MICSILSLPQVRAASPTECDVCDTPIPAGAWFGVHECGAQICSSECLKALQPPPDDKDLRMLTLTASTLGDDANQITERLATIGHTNSELRLHLVRRLNAVELDLDKTRAPIEARRAQLERAAIEWLIHRVRFVKWRNVA